MPLAVRFVVGCFAPVSRWRRQRQQATWASGDYAVIGTTLQIVGESLAEVVNLCAGERVLDVAAGNGNATLAAARRLRGVSPLFADLRRLAVWTGHAGGPVQPTQ